jgi:hypothetical protein
MAIFYPLGMAMSLPNDPLGYSELRNKSIGLVLVGNSLITLAYLLSTNPLGALLSHTIMHIAATVQGPETTIQLPPHRMSTVE